VAANGDSPWINHLTTLHFRVLEHVVAGDSYQLIADTVFVSKRTVCRLVAELKEAAGVDNMVGLGVEAVRRWWLSDNVKQHDNSGRRSLSAASVPPTVPEDDRLAPQQLVGHTPPGPGQLIGARWSAL
jgi:hypothetical protein